MCACIIALINKHSVAISIDRITEWNEAIVGLAHNGDTLATDSALQTTWPLFYIQPKTIIVNIKAQ